MPKPDPAEKFREWEEVIQSQVVERRREVRGLVIATLARAHHLQLGPPGAGKTYLVDTAMGLISDAQYVSALLHGFCVMEDIYGPVSLKALDEDRYMRKVESYLPTADFFFGDEVFRASPALLNTNLWAFNERKFRNDGKVTKIPLISAFFAANDRPEDPVLQAFDDRIHLRYLVKPITEPASRIQMFQVRLERNTTELEPVLSIEDVRAAHVLVDKVKIPMDVLEALNSLQDELGHVQIVPTDRKMSDALGIIQATAFLNGHGVATIGDMTMLQDMFWHNPNDRPIVAEKVRELASPLDKEAQLLADDIEGLASEVEEIILIDAEVLRLRRGMQLKEKLVDCNNELLDIRKRASAQGLTSDVAEDARKRLHSLTGRLMEKVFKQPKDEPLNEAKLNEMIRKAQSGS